MSTDLIEPVVLYSEKHVTPTIAVEVLPFGLTINRILINGDGKTHDILIGPYDLEDHRKTRKFQNPIVGRYCNRVPAGEHHISKGSAQGVVNAVSNESPTVSLHGGPEGFDRVAFAPISKLSDAKLFTPAEISSIVSPESASIFAYTSPEGEQGYPGRLDVEALVAVLDAPSEATQSDPSTGKPANALGSILVVYRAVVKNDPEGDGKEIITPVNLTQHWGFNLDASYAKEGGVTPDIKAQRLKIQSNNILKGDNVLLPTGELVNVVGTEFDLNTDKEIIGASHPSGGYDHFYLFSKNSPDRQPVHVPITGLNDGSLNLIGPLVSDSALDSAKAREAPVQFSSDRSGIKLAFSTNQRGVQFYSGIGLDGTGTRKKIHGGVAAPTDAPSGGYDQWAAAFLEFHAPHSAFLNKFTQEGVEGSADDDTILSSSELYNHWVRIDVTQVSVPPEEEQA